MRAVSVGYERFVETPVMALLETDPPAHSRLVTRRDIVHATVELA
jgi:hypothetical protein